MNTKTDLAYINVKAPNWEFGGFDLIERHIVPAAKGKQAARNIMSQWLEGDDRIVSLPPCDIKRGDQDLTMTVYMISTHSGDLDIFTQLVMA